MIVRHQNLNMYSQFPTVNAPAPRDNQLAIRNTKWFPVGWKLVCLQEILSEMTKSKRKPQL